MTRIVLAGAGHANIQALRLLAHQTKAEILLVNAGPFAWYTGALPALIRRDILAPQARIDLLRLAAQCGARFIDARMVGFEHGLLHLEKSEPLAFDILSLSPGGAHIPGGVKPIPDLLSRIGALEKIVAPRVGILGAGAAGVEIALALRIRLGAAAEISLCGNELLPAAPPRAQRHAARELRAAQIARVSALPAGLDDTIHAYSNAPELHTGADLRVAGETHVFAAGDAARMHPALPRSGAIAVRQGRVLAANIRHLLAGEPLQPFKPPAATLAILSLDHQRALAWYGGFTWCGRAPMRLKTYLDTGWVK
jgi:selenide,water dikinase